MSRRLADPCAPYLLVIVLAAPAVRADVCAAGSQPVRLRDPALSPVSPAQAAEIVSKLTRSSEWEREEVLREWIALVRPDHLEALCPVLALRRENRAGPRIAIKAALEVARSLRPVPAIIREALVETALSALDDDDDYVRSTAGEVLVAAMEWGGEQDLVKKIYPALRGKFEKEMRRRTPEQPTLRINLLQMMAKCQSCRAQTIEALGQALHDHAPPVRTTAVRMLARSYDFGPIGGTQSVLKVLAGEKDLTVRIAALQTLTPLRRDSPEEEKKQLAALFEGSLDPAQPAAVQAAAAASISSFGPASTRARHALVKLLSSSPSATVRQRCASALGAMKEQGADAADALLMALSDADEGVQVAAARALGSTGAKKSEVIDALRAKLRPESNASLAVRTAAAYSLALSGEAALAALPELRASLKATDAPDLRKAAARALGGLGTYAASAEGDLADLLSTPLAVWDAARALDLIGAQSPRTATLLADHLGQSNVRDALAKMCTRNSAALTPLRSKVGDPRVGGLAIEGLRYAAFELQDGASKGTLSPDVMTGAVDELQAAVQTIGSVGNGWPESASSLRFLQSTREVLDAKLNRRRWLRRTATNPLYVAAAVYFVSLLLIFWLSPLWLVVIDDGLRRCSLTLPWVGKVGLSQLLLLRHHPRVLDAWVAHHLPAGTANFAARRTVKDREVHLACPVDVEGRVVAEVGPKDLQRIFSKSQVRLLIWGEGGAGKTSLACLLARWAMAPDRSENLAGHPMLPVLLEEDLEVARRGREPGKRETVGDAFLDLVRGQLQSVTGRPKPVPQELFEHLLRQRRVLVIVDHLSEMNEAMRRAIRPEMPDFPVNALVVTARFRDVIGAAPATRIKPMLIQGDRIGSFLEAYLTRRGKRELFPDPEFFDACRRLSLMVGPRYVTVLLAKLYAEQLISRKAGNDQDDLPSTIPDLMLSYLNELNRSLSEGRIEEREVQRAARVVAWECLKANFRPAPAARDLVIDALGVEGEKHLDYFEKRLRLIETVGAARDHLKMTLDPLAEYLAGLQLVEHDLRSEVGLKAFEKRVREIADPKTAEGFLLAVSDCYLARTPGGQATDRLPALIEGLFRTAQVHAA
jgi:HEAT repeat protein